MDKLHLQIYARTKSTGFGEQLSTFRTVVLGVEPTTVELSLDAPVGENLVEIRIDPDDKPSTFVLHALNVRSHDGRELHRWNGDPRNLGRLVDLRAVASDEGIALESLSNDPFFLIPLDGPEPTGLVVELGLSQKLVTTGAGSELADAVRSLQRSLRFSLDDLTDQQEGLQDALVVHQAHSRSESAALRDQISTVLDRTSSAHDGFDQRATALEGSIHRLGLSTEETRDEIFAEVREDWRSVRRQIADVAEEGLRQAQERDAELSSTVLAEIALLTQAIHRLTSAQQAMKEIRNELRVSEDSEALPALRKLKAEIQSAHDRLEAMTSSLSWRLTRPLRAFSSGSDQQ
jgi:hypothetical protein